MVAQLQDISLQARDASADLQAAFDKIFDACDVIRAAHPGDPAVQSGLSSIYEIGAMQDVVRQRLDKIVRIAARIADPSLPSEDPLLAGPQSGGQGLQQDDINRLLED